MDIVFKIELIVVLILACIAFFMSDWPYKKITKIKMWFRCHEIKNHPERFKDWGLTYYDPEYNYIVHDEYCCKPILDMNRKLADKNKCYCPCIKCIPKEKYIILKKA